MEITRHGTVIGRIVQAVGELNEWIARGRVVHATIPGPIPMPTEPATLGPETGELLRGLRDEERW